MWSSAGLWLVLASCGGSTGGSRESVGLPDYPVPGGVSAPFAGMVGNYMVVGGGCNFPDVPAADGGVKRFLQQPLCLGYGSARQRLAVLPDLPQALAYGATAETDEGLVCVGGMDADSAVTRAFLIESQPGPDSVAAWGFRDLPPLPVAIDNGAAASVDGGSLCNGRKPVRWRSCPLCPRPEESGLDPASRLSGSESGTTRSAGCGRQALSGRRFQLRPVDAHLYDSCRYGALRCGDPAVGQSCAFPCRARRWTVCHLGRERGCCR